MGHVEVGAHRVAHGVDIAQTSPGKGDARKVGAQHHGTGRLFILAIGHKAAQVAANELHGLFRHGIGKRGGVAGNISLHSVDEGIHTAGSGNGSRGRHNELRVQHGVLGQDLIAEDRELVVALRVRDNGRGGHLTAGTCRGGNGDHGHDGAGHLVVALVIGDLAAVVDQHTYGLAHIHGAAAAQSHDAGSTTLLVQGCCLIDHSHGGVGHHVQITGALESGRLNDILYFFDDTDLFQPAVRHQQDVVRVVLGQDLRQLFQAAHAKLDVLRNFEVEVFHGCSSFLSLPVKNGVRFSGSGLSAGACPAPQSRRCNRPRGPACPCNPRAFSGRPAWWRRS